MLLNCSEEIPVLLSGFLYFLQMFTGMDSINVALNKRGEFCGDPEHATPLMLDGITNLESSVYYDSQCIEPSHAYVIIHYDDLFSVQYVVVYHGEGNNDGQLNHFKGYFREGSHNTLCSEYPFAISTPGKSMRMNCQPVSKLFPAFQFNGVHDIGFNVSEIELHSLATELPETKNVLIYRGCFGSFGSRDEELGDDIVSCQMNCLHQDKSFIGIKDNKVCACGDGFLNEELLPTKTCSVKCIDGVRYCGGPSSYSVYIVNPPLPWFVGCYPFTGITLESPDESMTVEKCLRKCDNHASAKLRDGQFCICGDSVPTPVADGAWQCNIPCTGRPTEYCGSNRYEALYATCKNRSMTCSQLFQCDPESDYDMYGKCKRCKPGFIGEHCFEVERPTMHTTTDIPESTTPNKTENDLDDTKNYIVFALIGLLLSCLACFSCSGVDSEDYHQSERESGESTTSS